MQTKDNLPIIKNILIQIVKLIEKIPNFMIRIKCEVSKRNSV